MPVTDLPARSEIPTQYTWDKTTIFADEAAFEAAFAALEAALPGCAEFRGHLSDGPDTLADYFGAAEAALKAAGHLVVYGTLCSAVDSADQTALALADRVRGLLTRLTGTLAFAQPEMLNIGLPTLRRWVDESPRLAHMVHYFNTLERRADHVRSGEVEEILSLSGDPLGTAASVHGVLANTELQYAPAKGSDGHQIGIGQGNIGALLGDPDREVRRTAWQSYADAHLAFRNTMATCISAGVKRDVFFMRARGYRSSLEAALVPNHIPLNAFHNVVDTFQANLGTWHRYWRLRADALGVDRLQPWDLRASLVPNVARVPYSEAVEWISEGVRPLGSEYVEIMRRGALTDRWVDIYPNQGKRMGAFSTGVPGTNPFILMSYNDDIFSMSTLAHELGHSMHSYYATRNQPYWYYGYGLFAAEVASNMNQALTRGHLLRTQTDPGFQISVLEEAMSNFYRYFLVMPSLARLELAMHERVEAGGSLSADWLTETTASLFAEAFGHEVALDATDRARLGITWAQFHTHLYSNFYVYQYATGIAGANALAERVGAGDEAAAQAYLGFLKAGGSDFPLEILKRAGVDLSTPDPIERAFAVMAGYVDRLEELVGKGAGSSVGRPMGNTAHPETR